MALLGERLGVGARAGKAKRSLWGNWAPGGSQGAGNFKLQLGARDTETRNQKLFLSLVGRFRPKVPFPGGLGEAAPPKTERFNQNSFGH